MQEAAAAFELPTLTPWQRRVLTTAVGFIGFPYVWGGEFERPESPFGLQARGGFDCSGFAWRVYKLQSYPGAPQLADTLRGRTAAAMAGEVPRRRRIKLAKLAPADLMFFGDGGRRAKAAAVDHVAIYLGNGWLIQSSRYGVAVAPLAGWYDNRLAWDAGRSPKPACNKPPSRTFERTFESSITFTRKGDGSACPAGDNRSPHIDLGGNSKCWNGSLASSS